MLSLLCPPTSSLRHATQAFNARRSNATHCRAPLPARPTALLRRAFPQAFLRATLLRATRLRAFAGRRLLRRLLRALLGGFLCTLLGGSTDGLLCRLLCRLPRLLPAALPRPL